MLSATSQALSAVTPIELFKCLADETRLKMALLIHRETELCVCELTCAMAERQPKISRHLSILRNAGLLIDRRQGLWVFYSLPPDLPAWVTRVLEETETANTRWLDAQLQRLDAMGDRPKRKAACC